MKDNLKEDVNNNEDGKLKSKLINLNGKSKETKS
jgi:hypothetical protein